MPEPVVANEVQKPPSERNISSRVAAASRTGFMTRESTLRYLSYLLLLVTVTAVIFAVLNLNVERTFDVPDDGVWWYPQGGTIAAKRVETGSPGERAGIKAGDLVVSINGQSIKGTPDITRTLYRSGVWSKATYSLIRQGVVLEVPVILQPADHTLNQGLRFIALIYLSVGLYVLLRRWTAPMSTHFYVFCLVSFVFYSFHFTGKLNQFDWIVYWSNVVAWLLQPALFLHFSLKFPITPENENRPRWLIPATYLPGALLLSAHIVVLNMTAPSEKLRWDLDSLQMTYLATYFVLAAGVLWKSYVRAETPILRQQMRWVTRGTILAIAPFTLFYVIPYLRGGVPTMLMKVSVLSLVFLPLTFGYAIFRYRLMDVDVIFKRGMAYTIAAAAIAGVYFGLIGAAAEVFHKRFPSAGPAGLIAAIAVTAILFEPIRNWIQERLDRLFYRKRYDYRKTLIDFGRDLNSETDVDKMLASLVDRLSRTLLVDRIAVFLQKPGTQDDFILAKSYGIAQTHQLDLRFLAAKRPEYESGHLFFDNTHQAVRESSTAQETIRRLDLNYYIPCMVLNRTIAVLGLGKTAEGDFLSSEDVELLETLAGYIAIALQNASLYASLEEKAQEYERLKEFNENIVESINVGVFAVDLHDKIESWNSQMEVMYALPRSEALGRPLADVLPPAFCEEFYRVRESAGVHNLYKFRLSTTAGDTRTVNAAIAPLVSKEMAVIGRLVIVDDITERIEMERQLTQTDKLSSIGLLAAGVAHEVNTPLAVISSYAQLLAKQLQGDEKRSALLEKITKQTFRASEIVNNLLNFSRTSGTEFQDVDLNRIIHETLGLLEHQFKTGRIKVEGDLATSLPTIYGNSGRLQQVFLNLFLNAKDAMPGGGTLRVQTLNSYGVHVVVSDTGTGIAPEHIQRIYDPFFTTKKRPQQGNTGGTGLGLSVTYGIIQEHAGKIRVESRQGEGTRFYLEFPMTRKAVHV